MAVTEAHEPVVEMVLVGGRDRRSSCGAAHDRERGVEDRHTEDEQRDEQRCEEEVRLTAERLARVGRRRRSSTPP